MDHTFVDIRPRILVLGHSFIRRLFSDIRAGILPDNFDLAQCEIQGFGIGGGTVRGLRNDRRLCNLLDNFQPHAVILQIGGNDCCNSCLPPSKLAYDIYDLMVFLHERWKVVVYVCELFTRPKPRGMAPEVYEDRRVNVNKALCVLTAGHDQLHLWYHRRIFHSPLELFLADGCHLNSVGMVKFFRSIRLAIKSASEIFLVSNHRIVL